MSPVFAFIGAMDRQKQHPAKFADHFNSNDDDGDSVRGLGPVRKDGPGGGIPNLAKAGAVIAS